MKIRVLSGLVSVALAGLSSAVAAAPIAVVYTIDKKSFKKITAEDMLTFSLYDDDQCANLVSSGDVFAGDAGVSYSKVKLKSVKGGAKPPKGMRIDAVVDVDPVPAVAYVAVTSTAEIVPVPGACQLQAAVGGGTSGAMGPAGPTGPAGADGADSVDGATGPAGADGADGADGATGPAGADGADGADGATGPAGADGADGADGATGPAGADGATGPAGADGATGPAGADGATGPAGADGATGPAGADGATGPAGADGATGPAGADGATGPAGADGATGPAGAAGATGPAGADGATGPAGADGATGPAGADGATGPAGADGATGPAGADGATGPAGADGATGPAGADGATGPAGADGADGADGATGPAGAAGATGPAGSDGATGPAGADGATGPAGADGADGLDGNLALANMSCGAGEAVIGFDGAGNLVCSAFDQTAFASVGPATNIEEAALVGWSQCFQHTYAAAPTTNILGGVMTSCTKANIMLACRPVGDTEFDVVAHAPRADVVFDTTTDQTTTHNANGTEWYFNEGGSEAWGFAGGGDAVSKNSCDTASTNPELRMCLHVNTGNYNTGWRCGAQTSISNNTWEWVVLERD